MNFHLIPGGSFYFGAGKNLSYIKKHYSIDISENFNELVKITPFLISSYLVTEYAWNKFNGKKLHFNFGDNHPIDAVDREDVTEWALNIKARLPSESEWEYACKAGTNTIFYWGNQPDLEMAWTKENISFTDEYYNLTESEQKPPNAFGLVGMIGNLGEWVADDEYDEHERRPHQFIQKSDRVHANGILRGGWNNYDWRFNRSTSRISCAPDSGDTGCSARIVFDHLFDQYFIPKELE